MDSLLKKTTKGIIEYTVSGNGKPVLIVVGGHTNCKETIFHKGLDPNQFCFITPSRPGYGLTLLTAQNKTPIGSAELFVALLDELGIEKTVVIGISAGGLTALAIAANYPERVETLVLMSAVTKKWFVKTDKVYTGAKIIFAPGIERFTWLLYRLLFGLFPNGMTSLMFRQLSTRRPIEFTEEECQELKQMTLSMRSYQGFDNDLDQAIDPAILQKIACPTLILHSKHDNAVHISHARNAREHIKHARMVILNNHWGHLLWLGNGYIPALTELRQQIGR